MLRRFLLILSLTLLFGLGQQAAAVHAISHWTDEQGQSQQDKKDHHLTFCDKCAGYAALDSAADTNPIAFSAPVGHQDHFIAADTRRAAAHTRHYAARAPPSLV